MEGRSVCGVSKLTLGEGARECTGVWSLTGDSGGGTLVGCEDYKR